jgi:threonine/homoserine/homoserine lactone efflux protein
MLAFLPQFVDATRGSVAAQLLVLAAAQKGLGLAVLGSTALAAGTIGRWLAGRRGLAVWQERLTGSAMAALGLYLLARTI